MGWDTVRYSYDFFMFKTNEPVVKAQPEQYLISAAKLRSGSIDVQHRVQPL
jgi:hypothetical protein